MGAESRPPTGSLEPMDSPRAANDRPAFPEDAVAWLDGATARTVVALGSADIVTALEAAGHDVSAPDGSPERLPYPDRSVDVVVGVGGLPKDLDDVARVLRPGGQLALVWNDRDQRIPWARKLDRALGTPVAGDEPVAPLVTSGLFGFVSEHSWRWWEVVNDTSLEAMLRAELAHLEPADREEKVAAGMALYADYGRGNDGMQMPWVARCFKATVVERAWQVPHGLDEEDRAPDQVGAPEQRDQGTANPAVEPVITDGTGSELLLIDFR